MTAWDDLIADLERRKAEIDKAIAAVKDCRSLCEQMQPVCDIDFSRAPRLRELLGQSAQ